MGCDIHYVIEVKMGNKWLPRPQINDYFRNYVSFGVLAGVRNSWIIPVVAPRGFDDCHLVEVQEELFGGRVETKKVHIYGFDGPDYHTPSWVTLGELQDYPYWDEDDGNEDGGTLKDTYLYRYLMPNMADIANAEKVSPDRVRLVFTFDS